MNEISAKFVSVVFPWSWSHFGGHILATLGQFIRSCTLTFATVRPRSCSFVKRPNGARFYVVGGPLEWTSCITFHTHNPERWTLFRSTLGYKRSQLEFFYTLFLRNTFRTRYIVRFYSILCHKGIMNRNNKKKDFRDSNDWFSHYTSATILSVD